MIEQEFSVHKLNDKGVEKASQLAERFSELLRYCKTVGEPGREMSIVATKLEEASFFAKKSMAKKPENQLKS